MALPAEVPAASEVPGSAPALHLGFCGSMHDTSWPAVVALSRKAFESGKPLVPMSARALGVDVRWHLRFANDTAHEIEGGYQEILGDRLRSVSDPPVDALIGCTYSTASEKVAALAAFLQVPMVSYISKSTSLSSKLEFPYFMRTCGSSTLFGAAFVTVCSHFDWRRVGYMYESYSAAETAHDHAADAAHHHGLTLVPITFFHYPDEGDVQRSDWTNRMLMAKNMDIRVFGVTFSSPKVPIMLDIALELGMNELLLIAWEFVNVFSVSMLPKTTMLLFSGMLGLAESQSHMPKAKLMQEDWAKMSIDELPALGIPEGYVDVIRQQTPTLFEESPFYMNHAQLVDAIHAVIVAFGQASADPSVSGMSKVARGKVLLDALYDVSFEGASGPVGFTPVINGKGGDRDVTQSSLYEAQNAKAVSIGMVSRLGVDLAREPTFPNGCSDPRAYDEIVVCKADEMRQKNKHGRQECMPCQFVLGGRCVPLAVFAGLLAMPFVLVLALVYAWVMRARHHDGIWMVKRSELIFSEPAEQLGRGTYGFVVKAEYRGTAVAVKRVIPPEEHTRAESFLLHSLFGTGDPKLQMEQRQAGMLTPARSGRSGTTRSSQRRSTAGSWYMRAVAGSSVACFNAEGGLSGDEETADESGRGDLSDTNGGGRRRERRVTMSTTRDVTDLCLDPEDTWDNSDDGAEDSAYTPPASTSSSSSSSDSSDGRSMGHSRSNGPEPTIVSSSDKSVWYSGLHRTARTSTVRMLDTIRFSTISGRRARLQREFIQEMRTLAKLRHPCVVTVMGAVISSKTEPMLVMEYMDNGSLKDLLQNESVPLDELAMPMLQDIAQGVRFLHASVPVIVHSDLKASNVLVDARFRAKVADFGLSSRRKALRRLGPMGTPLWMSPELLQGGANTTESDVYAFGIVLYEVVTRKEPYYGQDLQEVLLGVSQKDPVVEKRPEIPSSTIPEMAVMMRDAWQQDPSLRPTLREIDRRLKALDAAGIYTGGRQNREAMAQRTTDLLYEVFPKHVAEALRDGRKVEPEHRDVVTIFFSDIVGFTDLAGTLQPHKVSSMLDRLYSQFDWLSHEMGVFKVETIGDAYMAVANLVEDQLADHAKRIAHFSARAIAAANETAVDLDNLAAGHVNIRVGFHSGPVVANVVGTRNPRYCLFGDTVNTASRMESNSFKNCIHCSAQAAQILRSQAPEVVLQSRGKIPIKGKGELETFWVQVQNPAPVMLARAGKTGIPATEDRSAPGATVDPGEISLM